MPGRDTQPLPTPTNDVSLCGRLAAEPTTRQLPSGDELIVFRVIVERPPGERTRVDTIDCCTVSSRVRRCVERADPGDLLEIHGALRRRFWRGPGGLASRYEVSVSAARLSRRRRSGA